MALCLAGLRGVDENIVKAARVDGTPTHLPVVRLVWVQQRQ